LWYPTYWMLQLQSSCIHLDTHPTTIIFAFMSLDYSAYGMNSYSYHCNQGVHMFALHCTLVHASSDHPSDWFTAHMHYGLMSLQITPVTEWFITHITGIWPLPSMYYGLMSLQTTPLTEWFITHITGIWPLPSMYYGLMYLQITLLTEWFITHVTRIWPLHIMCKLMSLYNKPTTEWFITHITGIWLVLTMCVKMYL
jgi:hypothetical protein